MRERYGLGERPVVLCAARLVPRKGQDTLIRALRLVRRSVPDAVLLLVGDGPHARALYRLAAEQGPPGAVVFAGGHPHEEMPGFYAAAQVFAMPCRTRRAGLEVEGLGIVFLEAAAAELPVVVGDSGGAPDTVRDGETGFVVDGRDVRALADRLTLLLTDAEHVWWCSGSRCPSSSPSGHAPHPPVPRRKTTSLRTQRAVGSMRHMTYGVAASLPVRHGDQAEQRSPEQ
ncbi:hypothetical protein GCM10010320_22990 [Streptomyces caelestis]|uniref:Glycosyltransferase involved in cell wall biosynthesis n=1 Tax=Streptomyces caelestis TaxID=36816 RepID=A0A7W9H5X2_9ACTN|nr:glycosyltransferase involved in cell wall biosynthesis [Streptomyces caelestis]GGW42402.1 hypothetical protein GCM10010320_22990 [Streptomyces caelestis]